MKFGCVSALLLITISNSFGQGRERVFSTPEDSSAFERNESFIRSLLNPQDQHAVMDSLVSIRSAIIERSFLGWRRKYSPSSEYTSMEDLVHGELSPDAVHQITFSGPSVTKLPKALYTCRNVEALELVNTRINKLPRRLNKLRNLKVISIYNNHSKGPLRIRRNKTVTKLKIRSTGPNQCTNNIAPFRQLDSVDLAGNFLTVFPRLGRRSHVRELILNENLITLEDLHIRRHETLEVLHIRHNKITSIPSDLAKFPNLRKLTFNHNAIHSISDDIGQLSKLEELSLYHNQLTAIPACLYTLRSLREIDLYYNKIARVDDAIENLANLRILYLANNDIHSLPENIGKLNHLQELYIHHNKISFLPTSLGNLSSLEILRFNDNFFATFPGPVLQLHNLTDLDCSRNRINDLPSSLLTLKKLRMLIIRDNPWENTQHIDELVGQFRDRGTRVNVSPRDGAGEVVFKEY